MRPLLRRTTLVLWLMLALLPLRGWAHATMAAAGVHGAVAVGTVFEPTAAIADEAMPCHASSSSADSAESPPQADGKRAPASCLLCDVCHAPLAMTAEVRLPAFAQPREVPRSAVDTRLPRPAPERLERPPRGV